LAINENQITFTSSFIELGDLSVGADATASGSGGIEYNNTTGVFTYTPPDLSGISTNATAIGTLASLTTTEKTNLVGAVNELDGEIGDLSTLTTSEKGTLVGAINEIQTGTAGMKTYHNNNVSLNPGTPTTINHAFDLTNHNSYVISVFDTTGSAVSVDVDTVDANNVTLTSLVGLTGVKVTIIGF
jgi:hypothetical protein